MAKKLFRVRYVWKSTNGDWNQVYETVRAESAEEWLERTRRADPQADVQMISSKETDHYEPIEGSPF